MLTQATRGIGFALGCALLVSCGSEPRLVPPADRELPPVAATPTSSMAATPSATPMMFSIGEIVWVVTSDPETNAPIASVDSLPADVSRITASALAHGLPAGSSVTATWTYNATPLEAFSREIVLAAPVDQSWISFHIDRSAETLWPAGLYEIRISLNGVEVQQGNLAITDLE